MSGLLSHLKRNQRVLAELMGNEYVRRVIGHSNGKNSRLYAILHKVLTSVHAGVLRFYFPKIFEEYDSNMSRLLANGAASQQPIANSVFAAASFNFGPHVVTFEHTDSGNKTNGLCPIFCTGTFDPTKGGHLVLRHLKLLVQSSSGSLAFISSATLMHGNVSIQPGEHRESFTQYAAGGLFRWVQYGFRSWEKLQENSKSLTDELAKRGTR